TGDYGTPSGFSPTSARTTMGFSEPPAPAHLKGERTVDGIGTITGNVRLAEALQADHTRAIHYLQRSQPVRYGAQPPAGALHPAGVRTPQGGVGPQPLGAVGQDELGRSLQDDRRRKARDYVLNLCRELHAGRMSVLDKACVVPGLLKYLDGVD